METTADGWREASHRLSLHGGELALVSEKALGVLMLGRQQGCPRPAEQEVSIDVG